MNLAQKGALIQNYIYCLVNIAIKNTNLIQWLQIDNIVLSSYLFKNFRFDDKKSLIQKQNGIIPKTIICEDVLINKYFLSISELSRNFRKYSFMARFLTKTKELNCFLNQAKYMYIKKM